MIDTEKIRKARKELNKTQAVVAEMANISQTHYSSIENGKESPSIATLARIADALGLSVRDLILDEEKNPTQPLPETTLAQRSEKAAVLIPSCA